MKSGSVAFAIADRQFVSVVVLVLAFLSQPVLSFSQLLHQSTGKSGTVDQSSATAPKGNGVIAGFVVNERHEPVAYARGEAFSADDARNTRGQESMGREGAKSS
jgi:hypothetical protein